MRPRVAALALALGLGAASAAPRNPFLPLHSGDNKLAVLTPPYFLDRAVVSAFERDSGLTVALDTYENSAEFAERSAERPYDLVILSGPQLARRLTTMRRLDRERLPNARFVQPLVQAKYAAYDRQAAYGIPFGWSAFGLLYDSERAREPPVSWAQAFGAARDAQRLSECGVVWPDAREESFMAAWLMTGVDPARARPADVKSAAARFERALGTFVGFAVPDEVGALAKGAACLGAGTAGEAAAVAARGGENAPPIRFAYPREGAPLALYAYAVPVNAPTPEGVYALLNTLLAPDNARRDAAAAGLNGAEEATDLEALKRLTPEPVFDPAVVAAMHSEWKRLSSPK